MNFENKNHHIDESEKTKELNKEENDVFIAFNAKHLTDDIEGIELYQDTYGKEKIKTLTVALVLCLNMDVDPPDVQKISPCARMEAWYDPKGKIALKALEEIGRKLQVQYERWQPRARYKLCLDPTLEEVKKLCQSLRRNAKDDRVLFHYNGHGVPRPTENCEIWVFNKTYTKYIPLSLYDLQGWMGSPSVYVFDCNNAERTIKLFESFCSKRHQEAATSATLSTASTGSTTKSSTNQPAGFRYQPTQLGVPVTMDTTIMLAACKENENLPMNPEVPADLFTACLTTPIVMALRWYWIKHRDRFPGLIYEDMLHRIPGTCSNRQSMLGELNWVFTAVTDTIAWSCLSMDLFQKLFRQDLLVASLLRNFLLADRIMRAYGATPVSHPPLPTTFNHPMWEAWDHALDNFLEQLPALVATTPVPSQPEQHPNILPHTAPSGLELSMVATQLSPLAGGLGDTGGDYSDFDTDSDESSLEGDTVGPPQTDQMKRVQFQRAPIYTRQEAPRGHRDSYIASLSRTQQQHPSQQKLSIPPTPTPPIAYRHTNFFFNQLTAFEVWLSTANEYKAPALQLPVLLQVLLSQVHRIKALDLLSQYVDLGSWAVTMSLSVGIFPYMVRLLQSPVPEVKPLLVFIWCKIIASAETDFPRNDVVKESGCKYFISCLTEAEKHTPRTRTMAAFILSKMLDKNPPGQEILLKDNLMSDILCQLDHNPPDLNTESFIRLRLWLILCLSKFWSHNDSVKWCGVRNTIQQKLYPYLRDVSPEVRAATVCALGTFIDNRSYDGTRTDHATQVDHNVASNLMQESARDGSTLVRKELVVALCALVRHFQHQFVAMGYQYMEEMRMRENNMTRAAALLRPSGGMHKVHSHLEMAKGDEVLGIKRSGSSSNFFSGQSSIPWTNIYVQLWKCLMGLARDPSPEVANMAKLIVGRIRAKIFEKAQTDPTLTNTIPRVTTTRLASRQSADPHSAPGSPGQSPSTRGQSPPRHMNLSSHPVLPHSAQYTTRKNVDFPQDSPGPYQGNVTPNPNQAYSGLYYNIPPVLHSQDSIGAMSQESGGAPESSTSGTNLEDQLAAQVTTELYAWSASYFVGCQLRPSVDTQSALYVARKDRLRTQKRRQDRERLEWDNACKASAPSMQQIFVQKNSHTPAVLRFHSHHPQLIIADRGGVTVWDWLHGRQLQYLVCKPPSGCDVGTSVDAEEGSGCERVTALELVNEEEEQGLVLVGSDDGSVRVWRNYAKDMGQHPELVTAWIALTDMLQSNRQAGMVTHWSQTFGQLTVSGDVKVVRLWDSVQEAAIQDMPTLADSCVSSLERSADGRLVFAGFGDGTVRLFDVRASPATCVQPAGQRDTSWIHTIKLNSSNDKLYTIGHTGHITHFNVSMMDKKKPRSSKDPAWPVHGEPGKRREALSSHHDRSNGMRSFSKGSQLKPILQGLPVYCAHVKVDLPSSPEGMAVMGLGTPDSSHEVSLFQTSSGRPLASFKFYDGFSREKIAQPTCVNFHPNQPIVGMGFEDSMILILSLKPK